MDMITMVLSIFGGIGGATGIFTLLTIKPKKEAMSVDTLQKVIIEVQKNHDLFKKESEVKMQKLECKFNRLELKETLQTQSINKGYGCTHLLASKEEGAVCPIISDFSKSLRVMDDINTKKLKDGIKCG